MMNNSALDVSFSPSLSVVIRCRNQARTLARVLTALSLQEYSRPYELIVVDNDSTDDTAKVAREHGAKIVAVKRDEYTHGRAINRGLQAAGGELVLLLSAHSLPLGRHFLESAVAPFRDGQMAAAMCIKSDVAEFTGRWYEPEDLHWSAGSTPATPAAMFAGVRKLMNSGLVVRREVWQKIPFDETLESSEDKEWAMRVLSEGYKIRRCCEAVYVYLLSRDRSNSVQRTIRSALAAYRITGEAPLSQKQYWRRVLRTFIVAARHARWHIQDELAISKGLRDIPRNAKAAPQIGSREENEAHR
jgi:glycosyltransferase involved in cell wall biosynthesis